MMRQLIAYAGNQMQENPSIAAGICVFVVAFSLVSANALNQTGGHPEPIWATRDMVTTRSVDRTPSSRVPASKSLVILPTEHVPIPLMRPDRLASQAQLPESPDMALQVQQELARLGYYRAEIDGVYGPQTRKAVLEFERAAGLPEDGSINRLLLAEIRAAAKRPADRKISTFPSDRSQTLQPTVGELRQSAMIARIQIGLSNFGETGIVINGTMDDATAVAIRKFQKRYNLPIDGEPSNDLMAKLEEIGVLGRR